jgi:hypothetical protein
LNIFEKLRQGLGKQSSEGEGGDLQPLKDANEQPPDEQKLVEFVRDKVEQSRQGNTRISIEGIYLTNVAYLMGYDGVYYDTTYRQFRNVDPKRKISRSRFKVNKILPLSQNRLARLTQSPPRYDVRPNSNSTEDKDSARLGLQIIENIFDQQRFDEKRQDIHMTAMQGGHSYAQVLWDPTLGKPMIDPDSGELTGFEGEPRIEVLNCLEVFPDPLAKSVEDSQHMIKAKVRKLEYFRARYPGRGEAVKEEGAWLMSSIYDLKSNALTSVGVAGASTASQMKNSAIELVYYERRSKEYPRGRRIICANGVLLEDDELPVGEFDIVKFDDIKIGGRYNAESVITHARPVQDQYNITRTKIADWIKKLLAGKYMAPKGSGLGQEAINSESGEVIEYNPVPNASPPQAMEIPQIPSYVYKDLEVLDQELDYIFGINEVSRGVLPSASIPAAGMAFLQEQDQTRIGVQTTSNEIGYAKLGCLILKYVGKYYQIPRILKIAGDGLEYTVKEFVGADLNDNYDVIVVPGSTIPQSKYLRRQDIMNAFNTGLLGDPADPKVRAKVLKQIEFGDIAEVWKTQALDEAQVKKVIGLIEQGTESEVVKSLNEFDNQSYHLQEMNDYRKTDKFSALDDRKQKLFMFVMEWRLQALIKTNNPDIPQQQQIAEHMVGAMDKQQAEMQAHVGGQPMDQSANPLPPRPAVQPIQQNQVGA